MLFDVPLVAGEAYVSLLKGNTHRLSSVHLSLADPLINDARQRLPGVEGSRNVLGVLDQLPGVDTFLLMNGGVHAPDRYFDTNGLAAIWRTLAPLMEEHHLTGIVFSDAYFLNALSQTAPGLAARLQAVPSINCRPDSPGRVFSLLRMIDNTAFRPPSRLVLDRELNRDPVQLERTVTEVRAARPELKLLLMVNEGCLPHCAYRTAHGAQIAMVNEGLCPERTFAMNRDLGCVRSFITRPGNLLASPFIRPEDLDRYAGLVDGFKICGRNRGKEFLHRTVSAYLRGEYTGNLLDLMDTSGDLDTRMHISNGELPHDFFDRVTRCHKDCDSCGWCQRLFKDVGRELDPGLPKFKG